MARLGLTYWKTRYIIYPHLPQHVLLVLTLVSILLTRFNCNYVFSFQNQTAFTTKKDYGREEREAQWAATQRTLHGLQPAPERASLFLEKNSYRELSEIAEQAKRRAEIAR